MITRNVASKYSCLLQVLVAVLLLVSCAAFVKRYPDPRNCHDYFLRIDDTFYPLTCPNNLVFDQYKQQCTLNKCTSPEIVPLSTGDCDQNKEGYYCETTTSFTYCTHDGLKIVNNVNCPGGGLCGVPDNNKPCGP